MAGSFNIYLSSADSLSSYPDNRALDFNTLLPERIQLESGGWRCGLTQLVLPHTPGNVGTDGEVPLYLCCNICDDSIVGEKKLPVLARVTENHTEPSHVTYVKLRTRALSTVRVYLTDRHGAPASLRGGTSYCTLQFCNDEDSHDDA